MRNAWTNKFGEKSAFLALLVGGALTALAAQACSIDKGKYTFDDQLFGGDVTDPNAGSNSVGGGSFAGHGNPGGGMENGGDAGTGPNGGDAGDSNPGGGNPGAGTGNGNGDCTLGEHACTADGHLQTCRPGKPPAFDAGVDCGEEGRCSASQGVCLKCAPGEFQCANATLQQCNIFGSAFEDTAVCDSKASCVASDQKGYCVHCKAGTASCESTEVSETTSDSDSAAYEANRLLICNADGSGVDTSSVCEADQSVCNATGKSCQRCTPNAYFCDGATLNQCASDGSNYTQIKTCNLAALCDATNGVCNASDCNPGQYNCSGATLQSCGRDGKWTTLDTCDSAAQCDSSYGRCQACSTSGSSCSNSNIQLCDYNNGQYTPYAYEACTANTCTVSGGYANCGQCRLGTITCQPNSNAYSLCAPGNIPTNFDCPTGQICNLAAVTDTTAPRCVTCVPGDYTCDSNGTVLKQCSADGSSYNLVENCQTSNKFCDAGRGMCLQANPGSFACADNGDLLEITYQNHVATSAVVESCGSKNLCDQYSAACRKGNCVVGETTCSGADVYSCPTGDYRNRTGTRCTTTTRCQDGFGCVKALAIAAGDAHTCAIVAGPDAMEGDSGYVLCWGANESGQLGDGSPLLSDSKEARQVVVSQSDGGTTSTGPHVLAPYFSGLCAGKNFTCADLNPGGDAGKGFVACWGSNAKGQLGVNLADPGPYSAPFSAVSDGSNSSDNGIAIGQVTCGAEFACALAVDGTAYCWGANESGQLGTGSVGLPSIAATAIDGYLFTQLTAGAHHVCGVQADGGVYCWGDGSLGQLGSGVKKGVASPTLVGKISAVSDRPLALGNDFTLALAGKVAKNPWAWGSNQFGQLGDGSQTDSLLPTALAGITTADIGSAGTVYSGSTAEHACARIGDTLECWGANVFGEVGDGSTDDRASPVVIFDGKTTATTLAPGNHSVAVGGRHTCAITVKGDVMCWGANHRYQLGSSVVTPQRTPVRGY